MLAKKELAYVPIIGWMWYFTEMVFCTRKWEQDRKTVSKSLLHLRDYPEKYFVREAPEQLPALCPAASGTHLSSLTCHTPARPPPTAHTASEAERNPQDALVTHTQDARLSHTQDARLTYTLRMLVSHAHTLRMLHTHGTHTAPRRPSLGRERRDTGLGPPQGTCSCQATPTRALPKASCGTMRA